MTTKLTQRERDAKIVGDALAEVLPPLKQWWWQESHLLKLNLLLIIPLLSSSVSGFDGKNWFQMNSIIETELMTTSLYLQAP